ncbi:hypothetical protein HHX47_DHR3000752 [Lentinula edodes]|nr:hypothetical protein HHX47_DHR3000752 [Lentinula edodes]
MKAPILFYQTPGYMKAVIPFEYLEKSPQDKEGTIFSDENPLGIVTVCGPAGNMGGKSAADELARYGRN